FVNLIRVVAIGARPQEAVDRIAASASKPLLRLIVLRAVRQALADAARGLGARSKALFLLPRSIHVIADGAVRWL
ncbi:MAG TPA: hypothetical protein VHN20_01815, partial [Beijerinckiaceae bacterium]|nr:hypothetical protein [Beijerinckiaceae bacterium]